MSPGDMRPKTGPDRSTPLRARKRAPGPVAAALLLIALPVGAQDAAPEGMPDGIGSDLLTVMEAPVETMGAGATGLPSKNAVPVGDAPALPDMTDPPDTVRDGAKTNGRTTPHGSGVREALTGTIAPDAIDILELDTAPSGLPEASRPPDLRARLADMWRAAVFAGDTTLGFEAWLAAQLGAEPLPSPRPTLPDATSGTQQDRTRAASERWLARAGPVALGKAGRVVTVFGSAIPTAFCSPLTVCMIQLEPGEALTDTPSWGDTVRWQVSVKGQGSDTVLLEIKPAEDAVTTNLVIPTDRRIYTIQLVNDAEVHTPILAFSYPDTAERQTQAAIAAKAAENSAAQAARARATATARAVETAELERSGVETDRGRVSASALDFDFRVDGRAPFRPVRVFADGAKTYIDLPPRFRGALPAIVAGAGETNAALNTRVAQGGTRLIADRVITDIWLQSGKTRVRIRRSGS